MPKTPPPPQLDLAMQPPPLDPESDSALRAAYRQLNLDKKMTFESAMQHWGYQFCIRCKALSTARLIKQNGTPA